MRWFHQRIPGSGVVFLLVFVTEFGETVTSDTLSTLPPKSKAKRDEGENLRQTFQEVLLLGRQVHPSVHEMLELGQTGRVEQNTTGQALVLSMRNLSAS